MCVLYVSFGSKVRPRTFGCVVIGNEMLFNLSSRVLVVLQINKSFSKKCTHFVYLSNCCTYGRIFYCLHIKTRKVFWVHVLFVLVRSFSLKIYPKMM